jgi:alpha-1,2-mannosyltransferase
MRVDIRNASWLTTERARGYSVLLIAAYAFAVAYTWFTANGLLDRFGHPLGCDFANIWTAGKWVLSGDAAAPFDPARQAMLQHEIFKMPGNEFFGWHYPPMFLAVAAVLAVLPYAPALVVWQLTTLPLYAAVITRILPGQLSLLTVLAFPGAFINLMNGHNGFLTAALIGWALVLLPTRPVVAGILFGLLSYKPQFAIVIPIALVAGGYWKSAMSAALTVATAVILSWAAFGSEAWAAFFHFSEFTRTVVLEQGNTGWYKIQSVFAVVRMHGGSIQAAYAAQTIATLTVVAAVFVVWRSQAAYALKAAALCAAVVLATPYVLDYDYMVLGPAIAFVAAHGRETSFQPYEKSLLVLVWLVPMIARTGAQLTGIHIGLIATILLFSLCVTKGLGMKLERWQHAHG